MENWKDINEEEDQAYKARLVPLFLISQKAPMHDVMLEFMNTFVIKGTYISFGHKDNVYVISKQLIIDVFKVCTKAYVEYIKGQVSKSLELQALQIRKIAPTNYVVDQWNAKSLGLPYSIRYL